MSLRSLDSRGRRFDSQRDAPRSGNNQFMGAGSFRDGWLLNLQSAWTGFTGTSLLTSTSRKETGMFFGTRRSVPNLRFREAGISGTSRKISKLADPEK